MVKEPEPAFEINELMTLMVADFPSMPCPGSPNSTTTEDLSAFGSADFEQSCLDMDLPSPEGEDGALVVSLPASPEPTAKSINSRKREEFAGGGGDDEARKAQRMARNRRAAATSRARKKEHLESLQAQVDRLLSENAALRRRLSDAGLSTADGGGAAEDPGAAKGSGGPVGDAPHGDGAAADAELGLGVGLVA